LGTDRADHKRWLEKMEVPMGEIDDESDGATAASAERAVGNPSSERDANVKAGPGRMPTAEEEAAAEAAAHDVDLPEVAKHEREMLEKGANVKGEGQVP
jgi:hypothetical protein